MHTRCLPGGACALRRSSAPVGMCMHTEQARYVLARLDAHCARAGARCTPYRPFYNHHRLPPGANASWAAAVAGWRRRARAAFPTALPRRRPHARL